MDDNALESLSKTAETFIQEMSKGIEGIAAPWQMKRIAKAEIEVEKLKARAKQSQEIEGIYHQKNREDIIRKAIPHLDDENAKSENMGNDWKANFFDKCKNISDNDMQDIWSRILAGEANNPGAYSTATINLLSNLDREDANLFVKLNSFTWKVIVDPVPLIFDLNANIYRQNGISEETLTILDERGLIKFSHIMTNRLTTTHNPISIFYDNEELQIEGPEFTVGNVILTTAGKQILSICKSPKVEGIYQYVKNHINNSMPGKIVGELQRNFTLCPWFF